MPTLTRRTLLALGLAAASGCGRAPAEASPQPPLYPGETPEMRALVIKYAAFHQIPESLLHRVIQRESDYRPHLRAGPYYGLMQILPATARSMGFQGDPNDLLDPEVNLLYAGRYLRGAWLVSGGDEAAAVMWYARGYYYEAKRLGLLEETGVGG